MDEIESSFIHCNMQLENLYGIRLFSPQRKNPMQTTNGKS